MSEMVERVARAMCDVSVRDPDDRSGGAHPSGIWLDAGDPWWVGYEDMARAAIAAMRGPTPKMIEAFELIKYDLASVYNYGDGDCGVEWHEDPVRLVLAVLIAAALKEP